MPRGALEEASASAGGVFRRLDGVLQVCQVGDAGSAADGADVEVDVVGVVIVERAEEPTAEVGSGGAGEAVSSPDFPDRMHTVIPPPNQTGHAVPQRFGVAKLFFDLRHSLRSEGFIQPREELVVGGFEFVHCNFSRVWRADSVFGVRPRSNLANLQNRPPVGCLRVQTGVVRSLRKSRERFNTCRFSPRESGLGRNIFDSRLDPDSPTDPARDRFIMSKGHAGHIVEAVKSSVSVEDRNVLGPHHTAGTEVPEYALDLNSSTKYSIQGCSSSNRFEEFGQLAARRIATMGSWRTKQVVTDFLQPRTVIYLDGVCILRKASAS